MLVGRLTKKGFINKYVSLNVFEKTPTKIPTGSVRKILNSSFVKRHYYNPCLKKNVRKPMDEFESFSKHVLYDKQGGITYVAYFSHNRICVFKMPINTYNDYSEFDDNINNNLGFYNEKVLDITDYENLLKGKHFLFVKIRENNYVIIIYKKIYTIQ